MRLLLLSNSRNHGQGFFDHAEAHIHDFFGTEISTIAFVPYAGVTFSFDEYAGIVRKRLDGMGYQVRSVHESDDPAAIVRDADAVAVGGGNTFQLLTLLYRHELLDEIRTRVGAGVPFMGWSAGSNVACPTIRTTNDMPIVEPPSFDALGFVPFQINPHYLDANPDGHAGETREQRILEFIEVNRDVDVVGLREGSLLRVEGDRMDLLGRRPARLFRYGADARETQPGEPLGFLLK